MIQRIVATIIIATLYFFFAVQSTLQSGAAGVASLNPNKSVVSTELKGVQKIRTQGLMRNTDTRQEISVPVSSSVAKFNESDQSWTFSAKVMQLKDVSIYGKPGTLAQIEYLREGRRGMRGRSFRLRIITSQVTSLFLHQVKKLA